MPDGIGLAVDVLRPAGGQAAPTVVIQTRYWRSIGLKVRQAPGSLPIVPREAIARALLDAGYNVVVADVRGTGASAGDWPAPWSPAEVADGCALLDWVVAQPWSLPQLATYGTS
jgi:putative CocE/NonD family hydrolase